jgi:hypothetical protein
MIRIIILNIIPIMEDEVGGKCDMRERDDNCPMKIILKT